MVAPSAHRHVAHKKSIIIHGFPLSHAGAYGDPEGISVLDRSAARGGRD